MDPSHGTQSVNYILAIGVGLLVFLVQHLVLGVLLKFSSKIVARATDDFKEPKLSRAIFVSAVSWICFKSIPKWILKGLSIPFFPLPLISVFLIAYAYSRFLQTRYRVGLALVMGQFFSAAVVFIASLLLLAAFNLSLAGLLTALKELY